MSINIVRDKTNNEVHCEIHNLDKEVVNKIKYTIHDTSLPIAEIGGDAVVIRKTPTWSDFFSNLLRNEFNIDSCENYIFRSTTAQEVREKLFKDYKVYPYKLSMIVAEYHYYMIFTNKQTEQKVYFGLNPKQHGSMISKAFLRNETYYHNTFFRGHDKNKYELFDYGSYKVDFDLTKEKAVALEKYVNKRNQEMKEDKIDYNFLTHNCYHFNNEVMNFLFPGISFGEYLEAHTLDLKDRGAFLLFASHNTLFSLLHLKQWLDQITLNIFNTTIDKIISDYLHIGYKNSKLHKSAFYKPDLSECTQEINHQNSFGETPLMLVLQYGKCSSALNLLEILEIDINLQDNKGNTALHYLVMYGCNDKQSKTVVLSKMLEKGANPYILNHPNEHSPALLAAEHNDAASLEIMLEKMPLPQIHLEKYNDNLAHKAHKTNATETSAYLQQHYPHLYQQANNFGYLPEEYGEKFAQWKSSPRLPIEEIVFDI